ncbi:hypothetical protein ACHAQD_010860 [Fusarium lateritium]
MGEALTNSHSHTAEKSRSMIPPKDEPVTSLTLGESHSFSFLKDASAIVGISSDSDSLHPEARNELQYLSNSLTTAVVDKALTKTAYYVPPKAEGYHLIGRFLENASLGDTFFLAPSEELLIQVIFKPETVSRKGWVVYVNYMILAMLSDDENTKAQNFRQNMKLALNDSSIFLEPHESHLQALILLAIHGEDYSSPSLSWMLVGHACRQAEALGLHACTNVDYDTRQRRLSLFWLLFAVDKSCSLAFGRPCFLPSGAYSHVPLPDLGYLAKFEPRCDIGGIGGSKRPPSMFGAHMFLARMELAKLTGDGHALSKCEETSETKVVLRTRLVEWHARTNKTLREIHENERPSSSPNQLHEMSLGITTIKFEYLHTLMALTNGDPSSSNLRLEAAREAISLLPSMVSNWTSLFNGMIWYFILSVNLIQD